jgi:hypothetical protein
LPTFHFYKKEEMAELAIDREERGEKDNRQQLCMDACCKS